MFIFVINQKLWVHELMGHIMGYDNFVGQKNILKFVYYFKIIFLIYL
jgi:hypothetical protein